MAVKRKSEETTPEPPAESPSKRPPRPDWTDEDVRQVVTLKRSGMTWEYEPLLNCEAELRGKCCQCSLAALKSL
jgi:hypothetical protein